MAKHPIPDAQVCQTSDGLIAYRQDPFIWAKNSGQEIYQSSITIGLDPVAASKGSQVPLLSLISEKGYATSKDTEVIKRMATILVKVNADGVVDAHEKAMMEAIFRDAEDDGKLNGSVPNALVTKPKA